MVIAWIARITITSNSDGNICALQKGGNDGFTQEEIVQCGEIICQSRCKN